MERLSKIVHRLANDQSGITGLETAIVLIAFVVVAAVFSFTVLTTGIFTSQETRDASKAALTTSDATLETTGPFIGGGTCDAATGCRGGFIDWAGCPDSSSRPNAPYDDDTAGCLAHAQMIRFRLTPADDTPVPFDPASTKIVWFDTGSGRAGDREVYMDLFHRNCQPPLTGPCNPTPIGQREADVRNCVGNSFWCYRFAPGETDFILEPGEYVEIFIGASGGPIHQLEKNSNILIQVILKDGAVVRIPGTVPAVIEQVMDFRP